MSKQAVGVVRETWRDTGLTLDPHNWDELKDLGRRMVDDMLAHLETVRKRPVWQPPSEDIRRALRQPVPRDPEPLEGIYQQFLRNVAPYPLGNIHPRFWGWVIGTGDPVGALAEMLGACLNSNNSGLQSSARLVEEQVLEWLKDLMGYAPVASGILVSGGSMANIVGLAAAVVDRAEFDVVRDGLSAAPRRMVLYASHERHLSLDKAVRMLGLGSTAFRLLPVDDEFRVDLPALEAAIAQDRKAGHHPFCIVGNAGTVNTGAFDDLDVLADIAAREKMWLHVDGAFGALAAWAPDPAIRALAAGMERADSLAFDLHKWLHVPIEAACVLVQDPATLRRAFEVTGDYVTPMPRGIGADGASFTNAGPQQSRSSRALKIWFAFKAHGVDLYGRLIEQNVRQAWYLAGRVSATAGLELVAPVPLNVVCFRYLSPGLDDAALNTLNQELLMRLQESGVAAPSSTVLAGRFALRAAIANHRTRCEDLDLLVDAVVRLGGDLVARRAAGK